MGSRDTSPARIVILPRSAGLFGIDVKIPSYILYPGTDPKSEQDRLQAECAIAYEALKTEGNLPNSEVHVAPEYLKQSDAERRMVLRKACLEVSRRQAAAQIVMTLMSQLTFQQRPPSDDYEHLVSGAIEVFPGKDRHLAQAPDVKPAIMQLISGYAKQLELAKGQQSSPLSIAKLAGQNPILTDANNVQARVLRPSYPILHVAVALDQVRAYMGRKAGDELQAICGLAHRDRFVDFMMQYGSQAAHLIALTPELKRAAKQLIRFELS